MGLGRFTGVALLVVLLASGWLWADPGAPAPPTSQPAANAAPGGLPVPGAPGIPGNPGAAAPSLPLVLPIEGVIGMETTADNVQAVLKRAQTTRRDMVLLVIDSPGGMLDEAFKIADLLDQARTQNHLRLVALVRPKPDYQPGDTTGAYSAAALIALACPEIYMDPQASIGAAVILRGSDHTALESTIEGKKYASVGHAKMRAIAEHSGHSPLIAQAMTHVEAELWRVGEGDAAQLFATETSAREHAKTAHLSAVCVDDDSHVLTLTAAEARQIGLARLLPDDLSARTLAAGPRKPTEEAILNQIGQGLEEHGWARVDMTGRTQWKNRSALVERTDKDFARTLANADSAAGAALDAYRQWSMGTRSARDAGRTWSAALGSIDQTLAQLQKNPWLALHHGEELQTLAQKRAYIAEWIKEAGGK